MAQPAPRYSGNPVIALGIFFLGAAFVVYVLGGYPVLLALRARHKRPVRKGRQVKSVSVLLAVRNGEAYLEQKLQSLLGLHYPAEQREIIVISDGSTDGTEAIARRYAGEGVKLLRLPPSGKAQALNAGMEQARGEILFFTDVRQPLEPDTLQHLVDCFADDEVGAASGELIIREGTTQAEARVGLYWKYEKWIRRKLSDVDSILGATGCVYAMRRELAKPIPAGTLLDDVFLPLAAFFRGYRVVWEGQAKAYDAPTALEAEFYRKVRTQAGVWQIVRLYPELLNPWRNRQWVDFVSYKLGRLLLPHALLAMLIASVWICVWLVAAQGAFYLLALLDVWIGETSPVKRITSIVRTFVVMMGAAFCAGVILVAPGIELWKPAPRRGKERA